MSTTTGEEGKDVRTTVDDEFTTTTTTGEAEIEKIYGTTIITCIATIIDDEFYTSTTTTSDTDIATTTKETCKTCTIATDDRSTEE